jgi:Na+-transporting NADH:ubiquinone oxidoreductase subunit B
MHGWLFCLLLPVHTSPLLVVLGASFGVVIGALIVGGTGRYIVSPALLGAIFLMLGYPATFTDAATQSTWQQLAATGSPLPQDWTAVFLLQSGPAIGTASAAACAVGVLVLYAVGATSLRIVAGALVGSAFTVALFAIGHGDGVASLPAHWHWIVGYFPFCLAFIATDLSPAAATRAGRWIYGGLFGALVVTLRVLNPEHPEATLAACLLATLFSPLIDQCCVRIALTRWRSGKTHGG